MASIQTDLFKAFEEWYARDTAGDDEFSGKTGEYWRMWAEGVGLLNDLLTVPARGMSMREWVSIKSKPLATGNPFPDVRRKGGDHDRGFSPALNEEMKKRNHGVVKQKPCECGCGEYPRNPKSRFLPGHDLRKAYNDAKALRSPEN